MSCNLYKIPQAVTPVTITYTDCDGIDQLVAVPIGADYYFCSTNLISVPKETIEISICNCSCQSINVSREGVDITYVDCNNNIITDSIPPSTENPLYVFCAKHIINNSSGETIPITDKNCLSGNCNGDTSCYTFTPTSETGAVKYYAVNGDLITKIVSLPINFCGRGIFTVVDGVVTNNNTPCTSNYDCNECGCYEFIVPDSTNVVYIDCEGIENTILSDGSPINVCSNGTYNLPLGSEVTYNGICSDGVCVENCFCFTIDPNDVTGDLVYIECDNKLNSIKINASNGIVKICAQSIINPPIEWIITKSNLCLDAQYCVGDCECYVVTSRNDGTMVEYIDCNDNILTGYTSGVASATFSSLIICSKSILTVGVTSYSLGDCNTSICHIPTCDCYSIEANQTYEITYLDCDDNVISIAGVSDPKISFCAKAILYDSTGVVNKGYPCIDGVCITSPPPTTPLLYTLLKLRGPCPDICNGITKLGGLTGTDDVNIITQNPL